MLALLHNYAQQQNASFMLLRIIISTVMITAKSNKYYCWQNERQFDIIPVRISDGLCGHDCNYLFSLVFHGQ